ncbi:hypothetical protein [Sphingomonas lycopersici]|uniref:Uncharacterized protein n=1 Tax=Sphingomonas lycopersici TaxID=2951807 RepID=A0AA41ZHX1_9SPHN|nr:hypothetical protein [Sphingomonas lycopersici]MCW6535993.1 hypothetical protein [Sphingomonas lycopersici]
MIDWYRERAEQERSMAFLAYGRNARSSHQTMLRLLIGQCSAQPELDRTICSNCSLRGLCRRVRAQAFFGRLAA